MTKLEEEIMATPLYNYFCMLHSTPPKCLTPSSDNTDYERLHENGIIFGWIYKFQQKHDLLIEITEGFVTFTLILINGKKRAWNFGWEDHSNSTDWLDEVNKILLEYAKGGVQ